MNREKIDIAQLQVRPLHLFHKQWALVTAGDFASGAFNTMTIGWGALGTMWSKPFAFVAVRHSRYTYAFMEQYDTFTITAFPPEHHAALSLLGNKSGRDGDKIAEAGLTPQASQVVAAPVFEEAELAIECRKIYADDLNPAHFLDDSIYKHYPHRDFHCIYYGEIVHVAATPEYFA